MKKLNFKVKTLRSKERTVWETEELVGGHMEEEGCEFDKCI